MSETNTRMLEDFDQLCHEELEELEEPVNMIVKDGRSRETDICLRNISSIRIEKPGTFWTSEDGIFLFREDPETGTWLARYQGKEADVVVPEGISGIGSWAFENNRYVRSVHLPAGVLEIGNATFADCKNLKEINFPEGLTRIGEFTFQRTGLTKVDLPASLSRLGTAAFNACSDLETVIFRKGSRVTDLEQTFDGCTKLSKFVFPDHLESIANYCFYDCPNLKEVDLPATVSSLYRGTFFGIQDLYLKSVPDNVISSVVGYSIKPTVMNNTSTFTVHYKGHRFVLPREIDIRKIRTAETMIKNKRKDSAPFQFAQAPSQEVLAALETYTKYRLDSAKRYLVHRGSFPGHVIEATEREDLMNKLLDIYDDENIVDCNVLDGVKKICDEHEWIEASARTLRLMHRATRHNSFEL